jgi:hypothetical protein
VPFEPPEPAEPRPPGAARKRQRAAKQKDDIPPPPAGRPPAVPKDWIAISGYPDGFQPRVPRPRLPGKTGPAQPQQPAQSAAPTDSWTLIRTEDGRAGWVLTRMLFMGVPDEIAQYAERARISAWFVIGRTVERSETHPAYLWCALSQQAADYQFDSLRIFVWNLRRHRYETSFIERGLRGWLPLKLAQAPGGGASGFRVTVQEKDGRIVERQYSLQGFRARVVSRQTATIPAPWYRAEDRPLPESPQEPEGQAAKEGPAGLIDRLKQKLKR